MCVLIDQVKIWQEQQVVTVVVFSLEYIFLTIEAVLENLSIDVMICIYAYLGLKHSQ